MQIAGSKDGTKILIMIKKELRDEYRLKPFPEDAELITKESAKCLSTVIAVLKSNNITVKGTIKVMSSMATHGHLIEVDGPGYSILKRYSDQ